MINSEINQIIDLLFLAKNGRITEDKMKTIGQLWSSAEKNLSKKEYKDVFMPILKEIWASV